MDEKFENCVRAAEMNLSGFRAANDYSNNKHASLSELIIQISGWAFPFLAAYVVKNPQKVLAVISLHVLLGSLVFGWAHIRSQRQFWDRVRFHHKESFKVWVQALWADSAEERDKKIEAARAVERTVSAEGEFSKNPFLIVQGVLLIISATLFLIDSVWLPAILN